MRKDTMIFGSEDDFTDSSPPYRHSRIEKVQDLVLYRYGSTGVQDVVLKAVEILGLVPAFPVKSLTTFANANGKGVFRDCVLLWPGTTVLEFADIVHPEIAKHYLGAETIGNRKVNMGHTQYGASRGAFPLNKQNVLYPHSD